VLGTIGVRRPLGEQPAPAAVDNFDVVCGEVIGSVAGKHIDDPLADQLAFLAAEHGVGGRVGNHDAAVEIVGVNRDVCVGEYAIHQPACGLETGRVGTTGDQLSAQAGELLILLKAG
jgi:hypothetical protein